MIGWWDYVKPITTMYKKFVPEFTVQNALSARLSINNTWGAQITQNHAFFTILGLIRTIGYNEYMIQKNENEEGTLIALDLDRIKLSNYANFQTDELPICTFCKISKETFSLFTSLKKDTDKIGDVLHRALMMDFIPVGLPYEIVFTISTRIKTIISCFENCIAKYSSNKVIV